MAESTLRPALRNALVLFGAGIIVAMVLLAAFASVVAPYDPTEMKVIDALQRPSLAHPFGTDRFGRDVLSRTIHGSRIALGVAISSIGLALLVGTALGLAGGYAGGATDLVIGRAMDVLFSFPTLILAIGIAAILAEAALSYLGLGTQPPAPSWGTMLNEGRTYLETAPWMSVFPGLAIMLAVLGFNLLGDGLRSVLDPQLRGR